MNRWLLGLAAAALLNFVGLQAFHSHPSEGPRSCHLCAVGGQSVAHAPSAPALASPPRWTAFSAPSEARPETIRVQAARSRAPPSTLS